MTEQGKAHDTEAGRQPMPAGARRALLAGVALLLAGALYLIMARGEALLAALSSIASLCF